MIEDIPYSDKNKYAVCQNQELGRKKSTQVYTRLQHNIVPILECLGFYFNRVAPIDGILPRPG